MKFWTPKWPPYKIMIAALRSLLQIWPHCSFPSFTSIIYTHIKMRYLHIEVVVMNRLHVMCISFCGCIDIFCVLSGHIISFVGAYIENCPSFCCTLSSPILYKRGMLPASPIPEMIWKIHLGWLYLVVGSKWMFTFAMYYLLHL